MSTICTISLSHLHLNFSPRKQWILLGLSVEFKEEDCLILSHFPTISAGLYRPFFGDPALVLSWISIKQWDDKDFRIHSFYVLQALSLESQISVGSFNQICKPGVTLPSTGNKGNTGLKMAYRYSFYDLQQEECKLEIKERAF